MRREFVDAFLYSWRTRQYATMFFTGDLGYKALEPIQKALGEQFINAGVAEQNMVTMAAAAARDGFSSWCYSIAPFLYARAFEQIRNDVCQANVPVRLVGNGGGYGYGVMGPSHHALNDYGVLSTLPNIRCYIPAFSCDVLQIVNTLFESGGYPAYLRLAAAEEPAGFAYSYYPWRNIIKAEHNALPVVVVMGSIAGHYLQFLTSQMCDLWVVSEMPIRGLTQDFINGFVGPRRALIIVEEHVIHGGFGQALLYDLFLLNLKFSSIMHLYAKGYPSKTYGSKEFHRKESGMDRDSILSLLRNVW